MSRPAPRRSSKRIRAEKEKHQDDAEEQEQVDDDDEPEPPAAAAAAAKGKRRKTYRAVVDSVEYYKNWSGHEMSDLRVILEQLRLQGKQSIVYLAGDSSCDNKRWLFSPEVGDLPRSFQIPREHLVSAVNGFQAILQPPESVPDLCHWINAHYDGSTTAAIMTAVEATTLTERVQDDLLESDKFIRDHITSEDVLVVSVGGNDVAFGSNEHVQTLLNQVTRSPAIGLMQMMKVLQPLVDMLKDGLTAYLTKLVSKKKPKMIVLCNIYYPCADKRIKSWANKFLHASYDLNQELFKKLIDEIYENVTKQIQVKGCKVVPLALSKVLDPKNNKHYLQRVEPSVEGGKLIAKAVCNIIDG